MYRLTDKMYMIEYRTKREEDNHGYYRDLINF